MKKLLLTTTTVLFSSSLLASGMHGGGHSNDEMHKAMDHDMHQMHKANDEEHMKAMHEKMMQGADHVMTMPENAQMLMGSPKTLMLHFPQEVMLTAVQMMDENEQVLDINFELPEGMVKMYESQLSTLPEGTYTVKYFYMNQDNEMNIEEFWFMVH